VVSTYWFYFLMKLIICISIDQLDKAEAPIIPETYIYLLALQSLTALSNGFSTSVLPVYNSIIVAESENGVPPAPPALNIGSLPESTAPSGAGILRTTHAMLEAGWPALLAAHTFLISTNLSAPLFQDVLGAIGAIAQTCGVLGLSMPRDAFLGALSKLAIPAKVVSSLDAHPGNEVATPRSSVFADFSASLAGAGAVSTTPGLGERNLACLKLFIACAMHLAGSLGASWYTVLEALQNADYVLQHRALRPGAPPRKGSITAGGGGQIVEQTAVTLQQLEAEADVVLGAIQRLFESSKGFDDTAFHYFVQALARLSAEMVAMQAGGAGIAAIAEEPEDDASYASPASTMHPENVFQRRRVSGMHISKTQVRFTSINSRWRTDLPLAFWRLWYHQDFARCSAQPSSPSLSLARRCLGSYHLSPPGYSAQPDCARFNPKPSCRHA